MHARAEPRASRGLATHVGCDPCQHRAMAGEFGLHAWLSQCRLNNMTAIMRGAKQDDLAKLALLKKSGAKARIAAAKLPALISALV